MSVMLLVCVGKRSGSKIMAVLVLELVGVVVLAETIKAECVCVGSVVLCWRVTDRKIMAVLVF